MNMRRNRIVYESQSFFGKLSKNFRGDEAMGYCTKNTRMLATLFSTGKGPITYYQSASRLLKSVICLQLYKFEGLKMVAPEGFLSILKFKNFPFIS